MTLRDFCAEALTGTRGNSEVGMARQSSDAAAPGWPIIEDDAYYGIAGDIVRTFDPHTEADPVGILIQFLAHFGNVIGKSPYYQVEAERHHANLYIVLVGRSAKARKGVSGNRVRSVMRAVDDSWIKDRIKSGLSSGEGLINEVRDAFETDSGIPDKRLLIIEAEFANALAVMERPGNTLSSTIRKAWDGDDTLSTMSKNSPLKATAAHIRSLATSLRTSCERASREPTPRTDSPIDICSCSSTDRNLCPLAAIWLMPKSVSSLNAFRWQPRPQK